MSNPLKTPPHTSQSLVEGGAALASRFCRANNLPTPPIRVASSQEWRVRYCAYYRPQKIVICPSKCARLGYGGRAWSWPGYVINRTPQGVIPHELGHHVDWLHSDRREIYSGDFSHSVWRESGEGAITSYCPDNSEWFAEIFRLYVTNPDLLRLLRPVTFDILARKFKAVVETDWRTTLERGLAPPRIIDQAGIKIASKKPARRAATPDLLSAR